MWVRPLQQLLARAASANGPAAADTAANCTADSGLVSFDASDQAK